MKLRNFLVFVTSFAALFGVMPSAFSAPLIIGSGVNTTDPLAGTYGGTAAPPLSIGNSATAASSLTLTTGTYAFEPLAANNSNNEYANAIQIGGNVNAFTGTLAISGAVVTTTTSVNVGINGGNGALNISDGSLTLTGNQRVLMAANSAASQAVFTLSGTGALSLAAGTEGFRIGSGKNTLNLDGGTLTLQKFDTGSSDITRSTINYNGTTIKAAAATTAFFTNSGRVTQIIKAGGLIFDTDGKNVTLNDALAGTGGLTKTGTGTLTLTGANTYTGTTSVNGGTLELRGGSSASSAINVGADTDATLLLSGGTTSASGTAKLLGNGHLVVASTVSTMNGNLEAMAGSDLTLNVSGTVPANNATALFAVSGAVTGTSELLGAPSLSQLGGLADGAVYNIVSGSSLANGFFSNYAQDAVIYSQAANVGGEDGNYLVKANYTGTIFQYVTTFVANPIPEPTSAMLLGLAGTALIIRRRRK